MLRELVRHSSSYVPGKAGSAERGAGRQKTAFLVSLAVTTPTAVDQVPHATTVLPLTTKAPPCICYPRRSTTCLKQMHQQHSNPDDKRLQLISDNGKHRQAYFTRQTYQRSMCKLLGLSAIATSMKSSSTLAARDWVGIAHEAFQQAFFFGVEQGRSY